MSALGRIVGGAIEWGARGWGLIVAIRDAIRKPTPVRVEDTGVGETTEAALRREREHVRERWPERPTPVLDELAPEDERDTDDFGHPLPRHDDIDDDLPW